MKKLLVIAAMMTLSGLSLSAQDTIKLKKGEELRVKVLKVTPSYIEYSYPNEDAVIQIQKKKVASIHYESGRVEEFSPVKQQAIDSNPFFGDYRGFKTGEALDLGYSHYIKGSKFYWAAELGLTTRGCYYDYGELWSADMDDMVVHAYQYTIHHGIKFAPAIFGYRFILPHDFAIDLRFGGYFSYYYYGIERGNVHSYDGSPYAIDLLRETATYYTWNANSNSKHYNPFFNKQRRYNAGFETGIALWYKRFCFDFTYNVGFVSFAKTVKQPMGMSPEDYFDTIYGDLGNLKWEVLSKNYNYNIQFKLGIAF